MSVLFFFLDKWFYSFFQRHLHTCQKKKKKWKTKKCKTKKSAFLYCPSKGSSNLVLVQEPILLDYDAKSKAKINKEYARGIDIPSVTVIGSGRNVSC